MLRYFLIVSVFFIVSTASVTYAAEKEGSEHTSQAGSHHPPHTHHDTDHLKYIRGHGREKKEKPYMKKISS